MIKFIGTHFYIFPLIFLCFVFTPALAGTEDDLEKIVDKYQNQINDLILQSDAMLVMYDQKIEAENLKISETINSFSAQIEDAHADCKQSIDEAAAKMNEESIKINGNIDSLIAHMTRIRIKYSNLKDKVYEHLNQKKITLLEKANDKIAKNIENQQAPSEDQLQSMMNAEIITDIDESFADVKHSEEYNNIEDATLKQSIENYRQEKAREFIDNPQEPFIENINRINDMILHITENIDAALQNQLNDLQNKIDKLHAALQELTISNDSIVEQARKRLTEQVTRYQQSIDNAKADFETQTGLIQQKSDTLIQDVQKQIADINAKIQELINQSGQTNL